MEFQIDDRFLAKFDNKNITEYEIFEISQDGKYFGLNPNSNFFVTSIIWKTKDELEVAFLSWIWQRQRMDP